MPSVSNPTAPAPTHSTSPNVKKLIQNCQDLFSSTFDKNNDDDNTAPLICTFGPGRVNLIGEHVDYTGGLVLPMAIENGTVCYGRGRIVNADQSPPLCRIASSNINNTVVSFRAHREMTPLLDHSWANYVLGVIKEYLPDLPPSQSFSFDVVFSGDVPLGAGLSSSAALEISTARFLECLLGPSAFSSSNATTPKSRSVERALRCRRCDNVFLNSPCGIMDQYISSAAVNGSALLIDCTSNDYEEVPLRQIDDGGEGVVIVVCNSNVRHDNCNGEYPVRVQQCEEALRMIGEGGGDFASLRYVTMVDVQRAHTSGGMGLLEYKRAKHVVCENERTLVAAEALKKGDWKVMGDMMNGSHTSMRDDYEVSCEEIDILVEAAQGFPGVYGSRLTGGGFGGCTVTLVEKGRAGELMDHLRKIYKERTGKACDCFETTAGSGAYQIDLEAL